MIKTIFKFFILILFISTNSYANKGMPENYYKLTGVKAKDYFINYLGEKIDLENRKILVERNFVSSLKGRKDLDINSDEYKKLLILQKKYKIKKIYDYRRYFLRIDIIPPSMAIAQAATESGWGRSRFMKEANNIFGHWTYDQKIGMVPLQRTKGKKHLIRIFPTLESSIAVYMRNLNRNRAYAKFRLNREQMRISKKAIDGFKLSETMIKYSAIGQKYIRILKSIIRSNKLTTLDKKFYEKHIKD